MSYKKEMNIILRFLIILSLLTGSVAAASVPYPIFGKITLDGSPAHGLQIEIENLRTNEVLNIFTDGGEFVRDLSNFKIYTQPNDDYEIRYCVADSRCNQETLMFTTSGISKDLSRDITYTPGGLSGPYPVYGRVTQDSNPIPNAALIIENLNKAYSLNLVTNDLGEYNYNIANWGAYDIGDIIIVTYGSYTASFTILSFDTPGHELNINIVTPAPTPGDGEDNDEWEYDYPEEDPIEPEPKPTEPDPIEPNPDDNEDIEPTPEPNPEPIKGGLWLFICLIVLIVIGCVYLFYKKYKG